MALDNSDMALSYSLRPDKYTARSCKAWEWKGLMVKERKWIIHIMRKEVVGGEGTLFKKLQRSFRTSL